MWWLAILVILSPVLIFKGLTVEQLWNFFNVHPFWFVFCLGLLVRNSSSASLKNIIQKLEDLEKKLSERM